MRKYLMGFQLALSNELIYRANFLFGRVREIILYVALVFVYSAVPNGVGAFSQAEVLNYLLVSAFVSAMIFCYGMYGMIAEIADGDLTNYLVRPINYLWFWAHRMLASRFLLLLSGAFAVLILLAIFPNLSLPIPGSPLVFLEFVVLLVQALILIQIIDFLAASVSFWTHRPHGICWFTSILVQFFSGAYLPIKALPHWVSMIVSATPFPSLVGFPVEAFLGRMDLTQFITSVMINLGWTTILLSILMFSWKKGTKNYGAYGR